MGLTITAMLQFCCRGGGTGAKGGEIRKPKQRPEILRFARY